MPTEPQAISSTLSRFGDEIRLLGLEEGPLSEWLARRFQALGLPVVLMETRQVRAALSAMTVKTYRNDARGIAHLLRTGWLRPVHMKTIDAREERALWSARSILVASLKDIENSIRGSVRGFGLRIPKSPKGRWDIACLD